MSARRLLEAVEPENLRMHTLPVYPARQCVFKEGREPRTFLSHCSRCTHDFVRIHKTLRTTPAMAAKVTDRLWEIGDIVNVLEAWEAAPRG